MNMADPDGRGRGLLLAAAAFLAWGLLSPGNEILLRHMGPLWMQASRALVALAALLVWPGPRRVAAGIRLLRDPRAALALSMGTVVSFTFFSYAQTRIPATFTTLGFYTAPLWTALWAVPLLGERPGRWFLPAAAILLLGGALALDVTGVPPDALGMLLAVGSGVAWGLYAVMLRRHLPRADGREMLAGSIALAAAAFPVLALNLEPMPAWSALPAEAWRWTLIQVAVPTLLAIGLFQAALQRAPAADVNMLVGLELLATIAWASLLLDARLTALQWTGMAVVLAAVTGYLWSLRGKELAN